MAASNRENYPFKICNMVINTLKYLAAINKSSAHSPYSIFSRKFFKFSTFPKKKSYTLLAAQCQIDIALQIILLRKYVLVNRGMNFYNSCSYFYLKIPISVSNSRILCGRQFRFFVHILNLRGRYVDENDFPTRF